MRPFGIELENEGIEAALLPQAVEARRPGSMRLCDSFMCAASIVSGRFWSVIAPWLQSNW